VRIRPGPRLAGWHAGELGGQALAATRIDDLADRQLTDDQACGQRPVTGPGGVTYRVGEQAVLLVPSGRSLVQPSHQARMLQPEPQA
jgi:hypothetical protein